MFHWTRSWRKIWEAARPYAAEIGVAGLWATAAIAAIAAAADAASPGVVAGYVSPSLVIVFLAVFLGLSLFKPPPAQVSWPGRIVHAVLAVLAAFSACWAAWYHFERSAEARPWLAAAAAVVVLGACWLSRRDRRR